MIVVVVDSRPTRRLFVKEHSPMWWKLRNLPVGTRVDIGADRYELVEK